MDVDGGDGDLEAGTQPEQEPAHVELPRLAGRHHHRPPDEQAHDGECQQRGFPSYGVHQENCAQRTKHCSEGQEAAHPGGLVVAEVEGGVHHGGDGGGGVGHADPIRETPCRDGQRGENLRIRVFLLQWLIISFVKF